MTPQELKNSILQLAIQGKLVEQRSEEGTAEESEEEKLPENLDALEEPAAAPAEQPEKKGL